VLCQRWRAVSIPFRTGHQCEEYLGRLVVLSGRVSIPFRTGHQCESQPHVRPDHREQSQSPLERVINARKHFQGAAFGVASHAPLERVIQARLASCLMTGRTPSHSPLERVINASGSTWCAQRGTTVSIPFRTGHQCESLPAKKPPKINLLDVVFSTHFFGLRVILQNRHACWSIAPRENGLLPVWISRSAIVVIPEQSASRLEVLNPQQGSKESYVCLLRSICQRRMRDRAGIRPKMYRRGVESAGRRARTYCASGKAWRIPVVPVMQPTARSGNLPSVSISPTVIRCFAPRCHLFSISISIKSRWAGCSLRYLQLVCREDSGLVMVQKQAKQVFGLSVACRLIRYRYRRRYRRRHRRRRASHDRIA
jgi:hypothetical protein